MDGLGEFQISVKGLFVVTAVVAVFCGLSFAVPAWISVWILLLLTFVAPGAVIGGIIYGAGYSRAFAIGCAIWLVPFSYVYFYLADDFVHSPYDGWSVGPKEATASVRLLIFSQILTLLNGATAMLIRWMFERRKELAEQD